MPLLRERNCSGEYCARARSINCWGSIVCMRLCEEGGKARRGQVAEYGILLWGIDEYPLHY